MEKLKVIYKPLEEITPYENNPRINDNAVQYVKESISEYGFKNPIIIDKDGVIVAGHTRYKAAKELGLKEVPVILADDLTEKQVKAFRIADNKTSDFSIWDNKLLLEELEGLDDIFTGFDASDWDGADILDESLKDIVTENDFATMYEVVFRSQNQEKINQIKEIWDGMQDGKNIDSGDFGEETGE